MRHWSSFGLESEDPAKRSGKFDVFPRLHWGAQDVCQLMRSKDQEISTGADMPVNEKTVGKVQKWIELRR